MARLAGVGGRARRGRRARPRRSPRRRGSSSSSPAAISHDLLKGCSPRACPTAPSCGGRGSRRRGRPAGRRGSALHPPGRVARGGGVRLRARRLVVLPGDRAGHLLEAGHEGGRDGRDDPRRALHRRLHRVVLAPRAPSLGPAAGCLGISPEGIGAVGMLVEFARARRGVARHAGAPPRERPGPRRGGCAIPRGAPPGAGGRAGALDRVASATRPGPGADIGRRIDPVAYLRATPPFHALPAALFDAAAAALEIAFYPAGTWLVRAGGEPLEHLYVIRKGAVRLERDGQTLQILEEGETFGYTSLITREATLDVVVEEDLLAYELPGRRVPAAAAPTRASRATSRPGSPSGSGTASSTPRWSRFQPDLSRRSGGSLRRPASGSGAARRWARRRGSCARERISSVLVRGDPPGIVTDRDFTHRRPRRRGSARRRRSRAVASRPLRTLAAETPDARGVDARSSTRASHHLPVERDGEMVGVVTATDLLKLERQGPMAVLRRVERLASREPPRLRREGRGDGRGAPRRRPRRARDRGARRAPQRRARRGGSSPGPRRTSGPRPRRGPGSRSARRGGCEQTLLTDQDNALVYDDAGARRGATGTRRSAERVNARPRGGGLPALPGGHMARRGAGRCPSGPRRFDACIDEPRPHAAALLFDFRKVGGALDVAPLEAALARAGRATRLPALPRARRARASGPARRAAAPRRTSRVDLKRAGDPRRSSSSRAATASRSAAGARHPRPARGGRARRAHVGGGATTGVGAGVPIPAGAAAPRTSSARSRRGGRPPTRSRPGELSAIERSRLKEAFRAMRRWQERAAYHYRTDFF